MVYQSCGQVFKYFYTRKPQGSTRQLFFASVKLQKQKAHRVTHTGKLNFYNSCFLLSNRNYISGIIRGRLYRIPLSMGDLSSTVKQIVQGVLWYILYFSPKKQRSKSYRKKFILPWVSFFIFAALLNTHEKVWQSLRSRSLFKSACQLGMQSRVCQRQRPSQELG